jgi:hypothetical protein
VAGAPVSVVGARLVDVSPIGMGIESPVAMGVGALHSFRLVIAGATFDVEARVVAYAARTGSRRGYGVRLEFTRITAEARERLARALAGRSSRARA